MSKFAMMKIVCLFLSQWFLLQKKTKAQEIVSFYLLGFYPSAYTAAPRAFPRTRPA